MNKKDFMNEIPEETRVKMYTAMLLADISYCFMFDVSQELKQHGANLAYEHKKEFNNMKSYADKLKSSMMRATESFTKVADEESCDGWIKISDEWQSYILNLIDKLIIKDNNDPTYYNPEKIWDFLEGLPSSNIIKYNKE